MKRLLVIAGAVGMAASAALAQTQISGFINPNTVPSPDLSIDFAANYSPQGSIGNLITTSRNSIGTASDAAGNWYTFGVNVPRITNQGILIEEQRVNSVPNNTNVGAVTGSPGTLPTAWGVNSNGTTRTIVDLNTVNGVNTSNYNLTGTTGSNFSLVSFTGLGTGGIAALPGQVWTGSIFLANTGSAYSPNISTVQLTVKQYNSSGTGIGNLGGANIISQVTNSLTRFTFTTTPLVANTAFIDFELDFLYTSGSTQNFSFRIGWPQLELGTFATSPIPTTNSAVTRQADGIVPTTFPTPGAGFSYATHSVPEIPTSIATSAGVISFANGANNNNKVETQWQTGAPNVLSTSSNGSGGGITGPTWNPGVNYGVAVAMDGVSTLSAAINSTLFTSPVPSQPVGPINNIHFGAHPGGGGLLDGYLTNVKIWYNTVLNSGQLIAASQ